MRGGRDIDVVSRECYPRALRRDRKLLLGLFDDGVRVQLLGWGGAGRAGRSPWRGKTRTAGSNCKQLEREGRATTDRTREEVGVLLTRHQVAVAPTCRFASRPDKALLRRLLTRPACFVHACVSLRGLEGAVGWLVEGTLEAAWTLGHEVVSWAAVTLPRIVSGKFGLFISSV